MPAGYRSIILALGLILGAANHPNAESGNKPAQAQQSAETSLQNISSRYDEQAKRAKSSEQQEAPCGQGKYGSSADLCAQWKAADAAANGAWWAWAAGIAGIVSTVGVIAALIIGLHSNWIARDSARRELRAYIQPGSTNINYRVGHKASFFVVIKNSGVTPATNVRHWILFAYSDDPVDPRFFREYESSLRGGAVFYRDMPVTLIGHSSSIVTPEQNARIIAGIGAFYCWGRVDYIDAFKNPQFITFRYRFGGDALEAGAATVCPGGNYTT